MVETNSGKMATTCDEIEAERTLEVKKEAQMIRLRLKGADKEKLKLAEGLISNAAFMAVELRRLQAVISAEGCTEKYQNGKDQYGEKESTKFKAYNVMVRSYSAVMRQLFDLRKTKTEPLPKKTAAKKPDDGIVGFITATPKLPPVSEGGDKAWWDN